MFKKKPRDLIYNIAGMPFFYDQYSLIYEFYEEYMNIINYMNFMNFMSIFEFHEIQRSIEDLILYLLKDTS